jgi:hypothetical protein
MSTEISLAINKNLPNAEFYLGSTGLNSLVWLSENIDRPSDEEILSWVEDDIFLDWDKLTQEITNSVYFYKAYQASKKTLTANTAMTLLMATLTVTRNVNTLKFAVQDLLSAMSNSTQITAYTANELLSLTNVLNDCGFNGGEIINGVSIT